MRAEHAGSRGRCPRCSAIVEVPAAPAATPPAETPSLPAIPRRATVQADPPREPSGWSGQAVPAGDDLLPPLPIAGETGPETPVTVGATADETVAPTTRAAKLANWSRIAGFVAFPAPGVEIAAVTLGVMALSGVDDEADEIDERTTRRRARTGIILGVLAFLLHLLALVVLVLVLLYAPRSLQLASRPAQSTRAAVRPVTEGPGTTSPPGTRSATPPPQRSGLIYYYDLNTSQLFTGKLTAIAPIDAPSGPLPDGGRAGVKAYVFSYGDCADERQRFVAWLERATPGAKKLAEQGRSNPTGGGDYISTDELIEALTASVEVTEDAVNWRPMHPVHYLEWQFEKRGMLVQQGVVAKPCMP